MTLLQIPDREYHADRTRLCGSAIEKFLEERRAYHRHYVLGQPEPEPSDEMCFGRYVHARVLEPDTLKARFSVAPERGGSGPDAHKLVKRNEGPGKKKWADFLLELGTRTPVMPDDAHLAPKILDALRGHAEAAHYLWGTDGVNERVLHWTDAETGRPMRCRPDRVLVGQDVIVELKTDRAPVPTLPTTLWRWYRAGYHRKAALYLDGYFANFGRNAVWIYIFVETTDEPRVCVQRLEVDSPAVQVGCAEYRGAIEAIARCEAEDDWRETWERGVTGFCVPEPILRANEITAEEIYGAEVVG